MKYTFAGFMCVKRRGLIQAPFEHQSSLFLLNFYCSVTSRTIEVKKEMQLRTGLLEILEALIEGYLWNMRLARALYLLNRCLHGPGAFRTE